MSLFGRKRKQPETPPAPPICDTSAALSPDGAVAMRRAYLEEKQRYVAALLAHARRIFTPNQVDHEQAAVFLALCQDLPLKDQGRIGYEMARLGCSGGRSGFHGLIGSSPVPMPFRFYGWAGCPPWGGIAFQIDRNCFSTPDPLLFFTADAGLGHTEKKSATDLIREYSREITDIHVTEERESCRSRIRIEFRLVKTPPLFQLPLELQGGQSIPMTAVGKPVIQIPICGEFWPSFGEVTPEGDVVLHQDDFCMK